MMVRWLGGGAGVRDVMAALLLLVVVVVVR
jgi:hypothetical protein